MSSIETVGSDYMYETKEVTGDYTQISVIKYFNGSFLILCCFFSPSVVINTIN